MILTEARKLVNDLERYEYLRKDGGLIPYNYLNAPTDDLVALLRKKYTEINAEFVTIRYITRALEKRLS